MKETTCDPAWIDFDQSLKGIGFLLTGVMLFSLQDVCIKWISTGYPVHEILFIRSLAAIGPILLIAGMEGGLQLLRPRHLSLHLLHAGLIFVGYTSYYLAMAALPLAETVSLFFTAPLFITLLSIPALGEKIGRSVWIALSAGFFGMLLIARPGSNLLDPVHPSLQFLTRAWNTPSPQDLALMIACGLIAALGFYCLFQAYRLARTSTVTPFEYTAVPLGCLWGAVFWQEMPSVLSFVGMICIVVSGIHLAIGHRLVKRNKVGGGWTRPGA